MRQNGFKVSSYVYCSISMDCRTFKIALSLLGVALLCSSAAADGDRLRLVTTTSLYDTGLLDVIKERFEEKYNVTLDIVSKGTGIAIELGERGDADVIMVHDKVREIKFVEDGHGLERRCVAYNYFYVLGPASDPAGIRGLSPSEAFLAIMEKGRNDPGNICFVSRGDDSGTHAREKLIWKDVGFNASEFNRSEEWYTEAGTGMGATLVMANEKSAYTLCDMSTFMAYQGEIDLEALVTEGDELLNVYVAIPVSPITHPGVNCEDAMNFVDFLVSEEGQGIIGDYAKDGKTLFFKAAGNCDIIGCSPDICAVPTSGCPAEA